MDASHFTQAEISALVSAAKQVVRDTIEWNAKVEYSRQAATRLLAGRLLSAEELAGLLRAAEHVLGDGSRWKGNREAAASAAGKLQAARGAAGSA